MNSLTDDHLNFTVKKTVFGYITLFCVIALILWSHTLFFFMAFLFIYLLTDITVNGIHKKFPDISRPFMLYVFYFFLIIVFLFITLKIIPDFFSDFPRYLKQIETETTRFLQGLSQKYNWVIDFDVTTLTSQKMFEESSKTVKGFMIIFKGLSKGFIFFIFAVVLNFLLFEGRDLIRISLTSKEGSLMAYLFTFISIKIKKFYFYFKKVMGGQVIISLINTVITAILIFSIDLPHKITLLSLIFIFGLLPVIGNLISNSILCITAFFDQGIFATALCLILLVGIHKLEYFLNSKIIGSIVNLPMFITLMALLLGESFLGFPGIILAIPVVLFLRSELEEISC